MAEHRPDLAREMHHRGLAVGAGDGGDGSRLARIEARRELGEPAVRVRIGDDRDVAPGIGIEVQRGRIVGQDRDGALLHRIGGEGAAIPLRTAQRGKQKTGPDLTGIGGKSDDLGIGERRSPNGARRGGRVG